MPTCAILSQISQINAANLGLASLSSINSLGSLNASLDFPAPNRPKSRPIENSRFPADLYAHLFFCTHPRESETFSRIPFSTLSLLSIISQCFLISVTYSACRHEGIKLPCFRLTQGLQDEKIRLHLYWGGPKDWMGEFWFCKEKCC